MSSRSSSFSLPNDIIAYLSYYPDFVDNSRFKANLEFYSDRRRSKPDNFLISEFHSNWAGKYRELEFSHGFIQWIFPIHEAGMNSAAQILQIHEAEAMEESEEIRARVLKSYEIMLDFYGFRLISSQTGELDRSSGWSDRLRNLNDNRHNCLRITRILKSLGELGWEHLKLGFLLAMLREAQLKTLESPVRRSAEGWWNHTLRNSSDQKAFKKAKEKSEKDGKPISIEQIHLILEERQRERELELKSENDDEEGKTMENSTKEKN